MFDLIALFYVWVTRFLFAIIFPTFLYWTFVWKCVWIFFHSPFWRRFERRTNVITVGSALKNSRIHQADFQSFYTPLPGVFVWNLYSAKNQPTTEPKEYTKQNFLTLPTLCLRHQLCFISPYNGTVFVFLSIFLASSLQLFSLETKLLFASQFTFA